MTNRQDRALRIPPPLEVWDGVVSGAVQDSYHHEGPAAYYEITRWIRTTATKAGEANMQNSLHFVITRSAVTGK